jgi:hypothetical protein
LYPPGAHTPRARGAQSGPRRPNLGGVQKSARHDTFFFRPKSCRIIGHMSQKVKFCKILNGPKISFRGSRFALAAAVARRSPAQSRKPSRPVRKLAQLSTGCLAPVRQLSKAPCDVAKWPPQTRDLFFFFFFFLPIFSRLPLGIGDHRLAGNLSRSLQGSVACVENDSAPHRFGPAPFFR